MPRLGILRARDNSREQQAEAATPAAQPRKRRAPAKRKAAKRRR
jgi:hypothetical protein